jgi:hypothetical protein
MELPVIFRVGDAVQDFLQTEPLTLGVALALRVDSGDRRPSSGYVEAVIKRTFPRVGEIHVQHIGPPERVLPDRADFYCEVGVFLRYAYVYDFLNRRFDAIMYEIESDAAVLSVRGMNVKGDLNGGQLMFYLSPNGWSLKIAKTPETTDFNFRMWHVNDDVPGVAAGTSVKSYLRRSASGREFRFERWDRELWTHRNYYEAAREVFTALGNDYHFETRIGGSIARGPNTAIAREVLAMFDNIPEPPDPNDALRDAADQHRMEQLAEVEAMSYRGLQQLAKAKGLRAIGKRADLVARVSAPSFSDLAWAPVNDRYNHAFLPRNAPVPPIGDDVCGAPEDQVTYEEFEPGDHIVHRTAGTECFKKDTIDRIVADGGTDPINREPLRPWFNS